MIPRFALHKLKNAIERQRAELKLSNRRYAVAERFKEAEKKEKQKKKLESNWLENQIEIGMQTDVSSVEQFSTSDVESMLENLRGTQYEPQKKRTFDFQDLGTVVFVYTIGDLYIFITSSKKNSTILIGNYFIANDAESYEESMRIAKANFPNEYYALVDIGLDAAYSKIAPTYIVFPIGLLYQKWNYDPYSFFNLEEYNVDGIDDIQIYRPANKTYGSR